MAEAKKVLITPPNPGVEWYDNEIYPIRTDREVHLYNVRALIEAIGFPVVFQLRDSDAFPWEVYMYWKGIKFFKLCSDNGMKRYRESRTNVPYC